MEVALLPGAGGIGGGGHASQLASEKGGMPRLLPLIQENSEGPSQFQSSQ